MASEVAALLKQLLDSPRRVVLEHRPVKVIGYDGVAMRDALIRQLQGGSTAG